MFSSNGARLAVVATTPDDSHQWNLVGVQLKLEERGFVTRNLGACTPAELVAETVRDLRPNLLVMSTINGHGSLSLSGVIHVLDQYQVKRLTTIVAGGLLTTNPAATSVAVSELLELGCDAVFVGDGAWERFDQFLSRLSSSKGPIEPSNVLPAARNPSAMRHRKGYVRARAKRKIWV